MDTKDRGNRGDTRAVTLAEGRAFGTLLESIGYAPEVHFGRGSVTKIPAWMERLLEGKVFAVVPEGWTGGRRTANGTQRYTLYVAPVNGTTHATTDEGTTTRPTTSYQRRSRSQRKAWTPERKEQMRKVMKDLWRTKKGE